MNPRRYDLGELRDAVRGPPHERAVGEDAPELDGDSVGAHRGGPRIEDRDRAVPVERIKDTIGDRGVSSDSPTSTADAARSGANARDAEQPFDPRSDETPERSADTGSDRERSRTADDVESYLRSRHQRRADPHAPERSGVHTTDPPAVRGSERTAEREHVEVGLGSERRPPNAATLLAELSGPAVSKPYLDRLPDAYTAQLQIFEWLEWMLAASGHDGTLSALAYYESIGWLSEQSRGELENVVAGLTAPQATGRTLDVDDHRESLTYVARLAHRRQR